MKYSPFYAALFLVICSCASNDTQLEPKPSSEQTSGEVSERGLEILNELSSNPESWGESIGTLSRVPVNVEEALRMVSDLCTEQKRTWPAKVRVGTRHGEYFFLSSVETYAAGNNYDSGYLVHASTGEVHQYHVW
ncbi:MAG: hypothetical protein GY930_22650 [bacterium]|nr:hypothetical protein [bacterium]